MNAGVRSRLGGWASRAGVFASKKFGANNAAVVASDEVRYKLGVEVAFVPW